jgi:hypothetical protein
MKVLIGCEYSGVVRDAFSAIGHDAISCDLLPTETQGVHYQGDILDLVNQQWDLAIFHPPCTYLTNAGVSWLHKRPERWTFMREGAEFFSKLLESPIPRIAIENPIPHKYALEIIGRKYDQVIQPWMFGHLERKATCFWLKGLLPLRATDNVREQMLALPKREQQRLHYLPPSPDRWKLRSRTFAGIAQAMAEQWGYSNNLTNPITDKDLTP